MSKELEAGEKLDYFLVGLSFAVLAAAIQTSKFYPNQQLSLICEILAWAGLLTSGYIGIQKIKVRAIEWYAFEEGSRMNSRLEELESMAKKLVLGAPEDPANEFGELKEFTRSKALAEVQSFREDMERLSRKHGSKFDNIHSRASFAFEMSFMVSITLLAFARAIEPLKLIFRGTGNG